MLRRRVALSTRLTIGQANGAEVCELAVFVIAFCAIKTQAECLVAVLKLQVFHGLGQGRYLPVALEPCLHFASFFAIAFAPFVALTWAFGSVRACSRLEQCVDVCSDARHLVQCLVEGPTLTVQTGDLVPQFAVCVE